MLKSAALLLLVATLGVSGDWQREEAIRRYYENYYRDLYAGQTPPPVQPQYVPPVVNSEDDCEKLHNLVFQTRLGDKEIEQDDTFDQIVKILVFKKCDPRTFTKPNKNKGHNKPNRGEAIPSHGQNNPSYGQNNPNYGQDQPNYGQTQPNFVDQGPYSQHIPNNGQYDPSYGQNGPNVGHAPGQPNHDQGRPNIGQVNPNRPPGQSINGQVVPNRKPLDNNQPDYTNPSYYASPPQNGYKKGQSGKRPATQQPDYGQDASRGRPAGKPHVTTLYNREDQSYNVNRAVNGRPVFQHHDESFREQGDPAHRPTYPGRDQLNQYPAYQQNSNAGGYW